MTKSIALIVGGSSGMGKETAKRMLLAGNTALILSTIPRPWPKPKPIYSSRQVVK